MKRQLFTKCFIVVVLIMLISTGSIHAAAPLDTYTWKNNIGIGGCPEERFQPFYMAIYNDKIYTVTGNNYTPSLVTVMTTSGESIGSFGYGYGDATGQIAGSLGAAIDHNGRLYVSDIANGRVQVFDSNGAYLSQFGSMGTGNGQFGGTGDIAIDSTGKVYVTDPANYRVQVFDSNGAYLSHFGSAGSGNGQFNLPSDIAVDSGGNIYVLDRDNNRVQKFDSNGTYLSQFGGYGEGDGQLTSATGLALDGNGYVYVSDSVDRGIIQKFDSNGTYLDKLVFTDPLAKPTNLCDPTDIDRGADGAIYVADRQWHNVKVYASNGTLLRVIGSAGSGNGQFFRPCGLALAPNGELYVVDTNNSRVQVFDAAGNYLRQFGGSGGGDNNLPEPEGIAFDSAGNVFVSDVWLDEVKVFTPDGTFIRKFGTPGSGNGQLADPISIAIDSADNVYVSDYVLNRVQKFTHDGTYVTQWGRTGLGDGEFTGASGVTVDSEGNVLVVDSGYYDSAGWKKWVIRVQKFTSEGVYLSQFGRFGFSESELMPSWGVVTDSSGNVYVADQVLEHARMGPAKISVWNAPILPSAPQAISVKPSDTSLKVSWQPPERIGSSPITYYEVSYRPSGTSQWVVSGRTPGNVLTYTISSLNPNTTYEVRVLAGNTLGASTIKDSLVTDTTLTSTQQLLNTGTKLVTILLGAAGLIVTSSSVWRQRRIIHYHLYR